MGHPNLEWIRWDIILLCSLRHRTVKHSPTVVYGRFSIALENLGKICCEPVVIYLAAVTVIPAWIPRTTVVHPPTPILGGLPICWVSTCAELTDNVSNSYSSRHMCCSSNLCLLPVVLHTSSPCSLNLPIKRLPYALPLLGNSMSTSQKPHQRTSQACDACKRRKVRCNGQEPCQQCQHHGLPCVYAAVPVVARSRSRLGAAGRGAVIAESRARKVSPALRPLSLSSPNAKLSRSAHAADYDLGFFYNLVPQYMAYVYPISPILNEAELRDNIQHMTTSSDAAALVYACASIALLLMQNSKPWAPDCYNQASEMVSLSINHHKPLDLDFTPTLTPVVSRVFLEMCLCILH